MMRIKCRFLLLLFTLMLVAGSTSGCAVLLIGAGAAAGAGGVAYATGDLETTEEASIDETYEATIDALEEMGYTITERTRDIDEDTTKATIKARRLTVVQRREVKVDDELEEQEVETEVDKDKERVTVKLKSVGRNVTEMSIRIGTFGNEAKSRRILERIREKL